MPPTLDVRRAYLGVRRRIRGLVLRYPKLDLTIGRTLVRIDVLLRKTGLVSVMDRGTNEFQFRGFRFRFDEHNRELAETIVGTGEYEAETLEAILGRLRPDATFVDLGANIGFYTVLAAAAVRPSGRVIAFEPTPATAAVLRQNILDNDLAGNVTLVESAVSSKPGRAKLAIFPSAQGNSLAVASDEDLKTIDVEVTSLDAYFEVAGWPRIDLIKMDVEGQELAVFAGMHALAARHRDVRVIFEYHRGQLKRSGVRGVDLIEAARAAGFDTFEVLFRTPQRLDLPAELPALERLAARANVNIMAWRSSSR